MKIIKFSEWLENRVRGIRAISDAELDQIIKGEPYTSPMLGRVGFVPKSVEDRFSAGGDRDAEAYMSYLRGYAKNNRQKSRRRSKDRSWIIDLEIPEDEADRRSRALDAREKPRNIYARQVETLPDGTQRITQPTAVDFLDPEHVKKIRRVKDNPGEEKPRDATKFVSTFRRLFPDVS